MFDLVATVHLACPDDQTLERFVNDELPPEDDGRVANHVESCPACRHVLERKRGSLASGLKEVLGLREPAAEPPPHLDGYETRDRLGAGGMGVVWRVRDHKFGRDLALKVLQQQLCGFEGEVQRFLDEARVCGQLVHPCIVPVHDYGHLADGRPFFLMKLVAGRTLATLLHQRSQPAEGLMKWVQVFGQVCQAMAFAHGRAVIHRDLKPGNVMVGAHGEVQVMDWGLAKVLGETPAAALAETVVGIQIGREGHTPADQRRGTPSYMAPEQAQAQGAEVDRRADVFGLGAILCEILTGGPPFQGQGDRDRELAQTRERLRACGADAELIDLAERCLAANREDRPADAAAVAAAVARYLLGFQERLEQERLERRTQEVRVKEEGRRRKLWRGLVVVVGAAGLLLAAALVGVNYLRQQEQAARSDAEGVLSYLIEAFRKPDRENDGRSVTVAATLQQALVQLRTDADLTPLARAKLLEAIGSTYVGLGLPHEAIPVLEESLALHRQVHPGPDHPETVTTAARLATAFFDAGRFDEARPLYEETLRRRRATLGPEDPDTLASMNNYALCLLAQGDVKSAIPLFEETFELRQRVLGPEHKNTVTTMNNLGLCYQEDGQFLKALPLLERALRRSETDLGEDHPKTLTCLNNLARVYRALGRLDEALPLFEKLLKFSRARQGDDHPDTILYINNLAMAYFRGRQWDKAGPLLLEAHRLSEAKLGADHPRTLLALHNLAACHLADGDTAKAVAMLTENLARREAKLRPRHPHTLFSLNSLAEALRENGQLEEALARAEAAYALRREVVGPEHPDTQASAITLALALQQTKDFGRAIELLGWVVKVRQASLGSGHPETLAALVKLATAYLEEEQVEKARAAIEEWYQSQQDRLAKGHLDLTEGLLIKGRIDQKRGALPAAEKALDQARIIQVEFALDSWVTYYTLSLLGGAKLERHQFEEAEPLLLAGWEGLLRRKDKVPPVRMDLVTEALDRLDQLYATWDRPDKKESWRKHRQVLLAEYGQP